MTGRILTCVVALLPGVLLQAQQPVADLIVSNGKIPADPIKDIKPMLTMVGGRVV